MVSNFLCFVFLASFSIVLSSPVIGRQLDILRRLEISEKTCTGRLVTGRRAPGVCMFNFQCQQQGGDVIGTCIDGFLFGACCNLSAESLEMMFSESETYSHSHLTPIMDLQSVDDSPSSLDNDNEKHKNLTTTDNILNSIMNHLVTTISSVSKEGTLQGESIVHEATTSNTRKDHENSSKNNLIEDTTTERVVSSSIRAPNATLLGQEGGLQNTEKNATEEDEMWTFSSTEPYPLLVSTKVMNKIISNLLQDTEFSTRGNDFIFEESSISTEANDVDNSWVLLPAHTSSSKTDFGKMDEKMPPNDTQKVNKINKVDDISPVTRTELTDMPETSTWTTTDAITSQPAENENETTLSGTAKTVTSSNDFLRASLAPPILLTTLRPNSYNSSDQTFLTRSNRTTPNQNIETLIKKNESTTISISTGEDHTVESTSISGLLQTTTYRNEVATSSNDITSTITPITEEMVTESTLSNISNSDNQAGTTNIPEISTTSTKTTISSITVTEHDSDLSTPDKVNPLAIWTTPKPFNNATKGAIDRASTTPVLVIKSKPITDTTQTTEPPLTSTQKSHSTVDFTSSSKPVTEQTLLFWTTRPPPTRPQQFSTSPSLSPTSTSVRIQNVTTSQQPDSPSMENNTRPLPEDTQSIYENVIQKIASNLLKGESSLEESSTQAWGSSGHPIFTLSYDIVNNNMVPVLSSNADSFDFIKIPGFIRDNKTSPVPGSLSTKIPLETSPPADLNSVPESGDLNDPLGDQQSTTTNMISDLSSSNSETTEKPPLDVNLLMQLLNLTSYIPEAGIFIPPHLLTTPDPPPISLSDIEEIEDALNNNQQDIRDSQTTASSTSSTTAPTTSSTTSTTTTTTTATTTTTTTVPTTPRTPRTTTRKWDWRKSCGVRPLAREGRIVNGRRSDFGEWPWQALVRESTWLGFFTKNKCGGVLLNPKYVLTAAHCQPGFLASLIVVLGEMDVSGDYEPKKTIQRNVKRVVVHKDFIARTFDNDLALLELDSPVPLDEHIVPICLPSDNSETFVGQSGYVSGWGRLSYQGSIPNLLHTVEVPVIPNKECQKWFRESGHTKTIKPEFICAGYKSGKKDSCEGDSGGPLSIRGPDGRWILAGIVSHGIKCAYPNLPGVYMRMTYYKPWIERVMKSRS